MYDVVHIFVLFTIGCSHDSIEKERLVGLFVTNILASLGLLCSFHV